MQEVHVRFTGFDCVVRIGPNLAPTLGPQVAAISRSKKTALITDDNVAALYLDPAVAALRAAGVAVTPMILPPGESSKTLARAGELYDRMLAAGLDRASAVVGMGGGVVTDIAGFVAATYMRGVPWVGYSTTLLGQVDASVGGKTAVDHPRCKNLIGAFHQPSAVLADVATLATLPQEELRTGLAEVVKHGVIRDADLFADLEVQADAIIARDPGVLENIVARNIRIKADVVMADQREGGLRRILNYGHTIGHALESLALESGRATLTHGRAVALGMAAEARIAVSRGVCPAQAEARQRALLVRFGLPVTLGEAPDADAVLALMRHDKKAEAGRLRFILPTGIGGTVDVDDVTDAEVRAALASLSIA